MVGVTGAGGVNFWASENLSGWVHFERYLPEWRVLSKLSVQPCADGRSLARSLGVRSRDNQIFSDG